jgi:hypothetical protein
MSADSAATCDIVGDHRSCSENSAISALDSMCPAVSCFGVTAGHERCE